MLCGTNNKILRIKPRSFKAKESAEIVWAVPNIFGDDQYSIDVAITHRDGVTQADWWHNAQGFVIKNDKSTPHPVSPMVDMTIS